MNHVAGLSMMVMGLDAGAHVVVQLDYVARKPIRRVSIVGDRCSVIWDLPQRVLSWTDATGVVDEVHVVHAGRAGRHAGQARQAAVDVLDHLGRRGLSALQHVLQQQLERLGRESEE